MRRGLYYILFSIFDGAGGGGGGGAISSLSIFGGSGGGGGGDGTLNLGFTFFVSDVDEGDCFL